MCCLSLLFCSFPQDLQGLMWGDKDTFGVAFAAAGKAHLYSQVAVPPGVNFTHTPTVRWDYVRLSRASFA